VYQRPISKRVRKRKEKQRTRQKLYDSGMRGWYLKIYTLIGI
jgi:hypothetical protein